MLRELMFVGFKTGGKKKRRVCLTCWKKESEMSCLKKKTKKARRTAPSEWTRSIGFSTQALGAGGHETKAPFTAGKGISSGGLQDKYDKDMFEIVAKILGDEFGNLY